MGDIDGLIGAWTRRSVWALLALTTACGPKSEVGTTGGDPTETGGTTASADETASPTTIGADGTGMGTANGTTGGDPTSTGQATGVVDSTGASTSGGTVAGTTGVAEDCAMHAAQRDCEADGCVWLGDPRMGVCVPDVGPTGGMGICDSLTMMQCELAPQCGWDPELETCDPA